MLKYIYIYIYIYVCMYIYLYAYIFKLGCDIIFCIHVIGILLWLLLLNC